MTTKKHPDKKITVRDILQEIYDQKPESFQNDLRYLLAEILETEKAKLILYSDQVLVTEKLAQYRKKAQKLSENTPVHYLINKKNFMGLDFFVDERVLIPRFDTEVLVEKVIEDVRLMQTEPEADIDADPESQLSILELCTGSGAIAVSLAHFLPNARITATDLSPDALAVASGNARSLLKDAAGPAARLRFLEGDLFNAVPGGQTFNLIVSNPPYISREDYQKLDQQVQKEPQLALVAENEGLYFYEEILKNGKKYLKPNGKLYFEIGATQARQLQELGTTYGWSGYQCIKDYAGHDRVIIFSK